MSDPGAHCARVEARKPFWAHTIVQAGACALFGAGYLQTREFFADFGWSYFALTLAALYACWHLLGRLNRPMREAFPVWILLSIFCVGYFVQFFFLASDPLASTGQVIVERDIGAAILMRVYATTVLAFVTFCFTASWQLARLKLEQDDSVMRTDGSALTREAAESLLRWMVVIIVPAELILGYVEWAANIAVMGADSATLPFHLAGVIYYSRTALLPAMIFFSIWLADRFEMRHALGLAVALAVAHGIGDALLRSSRSALTFTFLELVFLLILTDRFTRRRKQFLAAGILISVILFPVLTVYRSARTAANVNELAPALGAGLEEVADRSIWADILSDTGLTLLFRVTGVDSLLEMAANQKHPIGWESAGDATERFNEDVLDVPADANNSYAPSLVGWFYFVGGNWLVVAGIACFTAVAQRAWAAVRASRFEGRWVAQTLILVLLVVAAVDGVLERLPLLLAANAGSVAAIEWMIRRARRGTALPAQAAMRKNALRAGSLP